MPEFSWKGGLDWLTGVHEEFTRVDVVFVNLEEPISSSRALVISRQHQLARAAV
ncbi:MAG TPA: hypothetical protein VG028_15235 [Terriglobia bacterium]|nr:hypothetical protein [Terriglobia bacterium]